MNHLIIKKPVIYQYRIYYRVKNVKINYCLKGFAGCFCMKILFRQMYLNIFALIGLGAVALLNVILFLQIRDLNSANQWFDHTQHTIESASQIVKNIYFTEGTVKNYLLSGDQKFTDNYKNGIKSIYQTLYQLKWLTRDNNAQQVRLKQLQSLIENRIMIFNTLIAVRKNNDLQYTINYAKNNLHVIDVNTLLTTQILTLAQTIQDEEKNLLTLRRTNLFNNLTATTRVGLVVEGLSLIVIIGCLILLNRQLFVSMTTEKKLINYKIELEKLVYYDSLTGLNNRISLINNIKKEISKNNSNLIALLYLDLDNFKNINDNFGPEVGDKFLKEMALQLKRLNYQNKFIARISGDEFVVLLTDIKDQNVLIIMIENILDLTNKPLTIDDQQIICTVSIGISTFPLNGRDEMALLKNADIALYRAKQMGKNNYQFCTPEMTAEFEKRAMLQHNLYKAVMNNEFTVEYQPKISLTTNLPTGAEALIRWNRPNVGLTYPGDFIEYAEKNGMIIPIGAWMLRTICQHAKAWRQSGLDVTIALNVSSREFVVQDFANTLVNILRELEFDPRKLEIEITESILLENSKSNITALQYLKSIGIKITIDDFGTGYSSLSYLNLLPIDKLKIDKSFIAQIASKNQPPEIIGAIISMAHSLGIIVIAEGVETQLQLDFLKSIHCDEIQGFLYSKALSPENLLKFYKDPSKSGTKLI